MFTSGWSILHVCTHAPAFDRAVPYPIHWMTETDDCYDGEEVKANHQGGHAPEEDPMPSTCSHAHEPKQEDYNGNLGACRSDDGEDWCDRSVLCGIDLVVGIRNRGHVPPQAVLRPDGHQGRACQGG